MERSSKRGKIPQQDWPSIMARYEAGETLANIARTYDCSPPAISYVVSRSRARGTASTPSAPIPLEPQLIKSHPTELFPSQPQEEEATANGPLSSSSPPNPPPLEREEGPGLLEEAEPGPLVPSYGEQGAHGNSPRPSSDPAFISSRYSEAKRRLHLPPPTRSELGSQSPDRDVVSNSAERVVPLPAPSRESFGPSARQEANGAPLELVSRPHIPSEGGTFVDRALRERVEADITAFLTAFDAALAHDTIESRAGLREATDRLLRAGARTRIELERLEARMPLPPRNGGKQYEPAGRQR